MPNYLSPGVYFREIDLSRYVPRLATTIAGMVGTSQKGPTDVPVLVTNVGAFISTFGMPHPNHPSTYSALQFLRYGKQLYFVRVNGADASLASTNAILGDTNPSQLNFSSLGPFTFVDSTEANVVGTNVDATVDIDSTNKNLSVSINGSSPVAIALTEGVGRTKAQIVSDINTALTAYNGQAVSADNFGGDANAVAIATIDSGESQRIDILIVSNSAYADLGLVVGVYRGMNSNLEYEIVSIDRGTGTETVLSGSFAAGVTSTDDVVAALNLAFAGAAFPAVAYNISGKVRVEHNTSSSNWALKWSDPSALSDHDGAGAVLGMSYGSITYGRGISPESETVTVKAASVGTWGNDLKVTFAEGTLRGTFTVTVMVKGEVVEYFDRLVSAPEFEDTNARTYFYGSFLNSEETGSKYVRVEDIATNTGHPKSGTYSFSGGDDGLESVGDEDFIGTVDGSTSTGMQIFSNPETMDLNLLMVPGISSAAVINAMLSLCVARRDCMAIVDPPLGQSVQQVIDWHNGQFSYNDHQPFNSSFGALYWPWLKVYDAYSERYVWVPPSGLVGATYAYNDEVGEPWFAPAGLNRGRLLSVIDLEHSADQGERDAMQGNQNGVNPIINRRRDGITVWGQKTLQRTPTKLDRVNVRRLLFAVEKAIVTVAASLLFEPNDSATWRSFTALVDPFLSDIQSRRGLNDYQVKCDSETNPPSVVDNNQMNAIVYLDPVMVAEKIQIDFVLTPTGANFDEIIY